uniref:Uncharacterized protein n=1 Tax=Utricularia reniformis TaxID=192314 RepID=A0A1Y0AYP5_9LAMI|nr:hypothetical protein AEK19_MT0320 [Utricularia reniformis]ART30273.1 hypothetical protein AEK19_MT0320 [Utricularia reniformis]
MPHRKSTTDSNNGSSDRTSDVKDGWFSGKGQTKVRIAPLCSRKSQCHPPFQLSYPLLASR